MWTTDEARAKRATGRLSQTLALLAICLGYFMTILDTTVVNVALPAIRDQLGANVAGLQWIVDGYALVFAGLLLTAGALGDRLGNRAIFLAGLVLFTLASALCGAAPALWALQATRAAQGIGAALMVPASLALLRETFGSPAARARAIGLWGGIAGVAAGSGPVVGGLLVDTLGWRGVFLVNVPIGILAVVLTWRYVAPSARRPGRGLDWPGQVASILALAALAFACIQGSVWGWSTPPVLGAFALAGVATVVLVAVERRVVDPMLPLELFGGATFTAATAVGLLLNFGFYGQLFLMSLFFQEVRGASALATGLALLPETGMAAVGSTLAGRATGRVGPRLPMLAGLVLGGLGLLALSLVGATTRYAALGPLLVAVGFGTSFAMPAMTAAVMEAASAERAGIASGVLNASRQVGGVLGVALLGALVGGGRPFVPGLRAAGLLAGGAFFFGALLTVLAVRPARRSGVALPGGVAVE